MGEVERWWCCGWQRLLFDVPARARLSGLPTTLDAGKSLVSTVFPDPEFRRPYYFWDEIIVAVILFTCIISYVQQSSLTYDNDDRQSH
jgi:hypothetical protein